MSAYSGTNVPIEKSQAEIRTMLRRYGADSFSFGETRGHAEVQFRHGALAVRMRVPIRELTEDEIRAEPSLARQGVYKVLEQGVEVSARRVWRVLYWLLKTRMEAIEAGVETFAEAFLAHLLDPHTERTVYESMVDAGAMRQLEAGDGS